MSPRRPPPPSAALPLPAEFYHPDAVRRARDAFAAHCRLRLHTVADGLQAELAEGTPRDLHEFGNYALALSLRMRRRTDSGSPNNG